MSGLELIFEKALVEDIAFFWLNDEEDAERERLRRLRGAIGSVSCGEARGQGLNRRVRWEEVRIDE